MKNSRMICAMLLCGIALSAAQDTTQAPSTNLVRDSIQMPPPPTMPLSQPVDISRMKAEYYRQEGFQLLPEYINDSTIGPGLFVAITNPVIRKNSTLTINPGTTIWFEPQRRFIVEGSLMAAATDKEAILLTYLPIKMRYIKIAIPDSLWNGIEVEPGGSLFLNRIIVSSAAAGISVATGIERIDISCVDMSNQVATPIYVDGKPVRIANPACVGIGDLKRLFVPPADIASSRGDASGIRSALRIGSCVVAAGGIGLAAYGAWQYRKNALLYEQSTDPARHSPEKVDDYRDKALRGGWLGLAGGIIGVVGIAGVTLTLVF